VSPRSRNSEQLCMVQEALWCRYHLPILFLQWKGVAFAERYMHARVQTDNYSLTSTELAWVWTQALMDFKVGDCQRSPLVLQGWCVWFAPDASDSAPPSRDRIVHGQSRTLMGDYCSDVRPGLVFVLRAALLPVPRL
jgi:hypothetical protein